MMSGSKIHIALAFCDPKGTYARHAAVTMASIFANTSEKVCIHLLHDNTLSINNEEKLKRNASNFKQEINLINVSPLFDEDKMNNIKNLTSNGFMGMLFRLMLPEVVSTDKIIYLDCDIVVTMDIKDLWEQDIGDKAVGVVRDIFSINYLNNGELSKRFRLLWNVLGVEYGEYFNSGVLLMNLAKIRKNYSLIKGAIDFFAKYGKCITLADQDYLNYVFAKDKSLLSEKFNRISTKNVNEKTLGNSIWHMAGGAAKPWITCTRPYVDDLYWKYLTKTPYCENEDALIRLMMNDLSASSYTHLHSSDCVKRLKKQMADNIFRAHVWTLPYILLKSLTRGGEK